MSAAMWNAWEDAVGNQKPATFREEAEEAGRMAPAEAVDHYLAAIEDTPLGQELDLPAKASALRVALIACLMAPAADGGAGWQP